jgi:AraC-like DNA-binding protein
MTDKQQIFQWLDDHAGEMQEFLSSLIQIPSYSGQEYNVQQQVKAAMEAAGLTVAARAYDEEGIRPNVLHRTQYPSGGPCKRLIIQFNLPRYGSGLSNEYEQLLELFHQKVPIFRFDTELQHSVYRKLNDIFLLAQKTDPMRNLIIHQKFIEFLTLLYLNRGNNIYRNESEMTATEQKIYAVTSYIHSHYAEDLSLNMLAQKFYISNYYLSHQFKDVTGFTLSDYIQMTRVRNVQAMLVGTQVPITEAAARCGFNSFSQFNRIFRKHIGMAPSAYRKKYQAAAI